MTCLYKLIVGLLVKKLAAFCWTRKFIAMFTNSPTLEPALASWVQSTSSHPVSLKYVFMLGYWLDDRCSRVWFPEGTGNFSLHHHQPPFQWVPGELSLGVNRPGREADHSPPSSAEVKQWVERYFHSPNTPSWRGAQLNHADNFTFTFTFIFNSHLRLVLATSLST
jgi:hypothetical protein